MTHKVIRITNISGTNCCSICGQPAETVNDTMQHKIVGMKTKSDVPPMAQETPIVNKTNM